MKLFRVLWVAVKPFVNFPQWMGAKELIKNAKKIKDLATTVVSVPQSGNRETFEQAVARLGLSEVALFKRRREFLWLSCVFSCIGFIILGYFVYHLYVSHWIAAGVSFVLAAVAFAMAFRNHFWYTQMKYQRLGLCWRDWFKLFLGKML
jgi:intracellular multiplication protein IcmV